MRVRSYIVHLESWLFHTQYDQSRLALNMISLDSFQFITRNDVKVTWDPVILNLET